MQRERLLPEPNHYRRVQEMSVGTRRVDGANKRECPVCQAGCDCEVGRDQGCGHYLCWGLNPTPFCLSAAAEVVAS